PGRLLWAALAGGVPWAALGWAWARFQRCLAGRRDRRAGAWRRGGAPACQRLERPPPRLRPSVWRSGVARGPDGRRDGAGWPRWARADGRAVAAAPVAVAPPAAAAGSVPTDGAARRRRRTSGRRGPASPP